ncbi:DUF3168 domain-containing protein [Caballeronia sp. GaOx3]|uniref:tail completion protein gp17 n=1 Tax=Caballeronia sp. GaOx3 TaxID=2921740 RepID=UPI002028D87E|nr:DUF3168 domain-containing protein [Caballeronia sp. GaOx3]
MNANQIVRRALTHLADGHVFADVADQDVPPPWIVYQAAGGKIDVDLAGRPFAKFRMRVQISVWHSTPHGRSSLIRQVVRALISPAVGAVPLGAPADVYEQNTGLHGARLDVSIWSEL